MGGMVAVTIREPDGTEHRQTRWTNAMPWFAHHVAFLRSGYQELSALTLRFAGIAHHVEHSPIGVNLDPRFPLGVAVAVDRFDDGRIPVALQREDVLTTAGGVDILEVAVKRVDLRLRGDFVGVEHRRSVGVLRCHGLNIAQIDTQAPDPPEVDLRLPLAPAFDPENLPEGWISVDL